MKKFIKGCLITALVLFVFGCAFYGICGAMGGFNQLKSWNGHTFRLWGRDVRLAYSGYGFWYVTDEDSGVNLTGWENGGNSIEADEKEKVADSSSGIRRIEIECGGNNLVIRESEDDYIWVAREAEAWPVSYKVQNGIFKLYSEKSFQWWGNWKWRDLEKRTIYLYLPRNMSLESVDLEIGAGALESIALKANEIDVDVDAGAAVIESLQGSEVDLSVNAGGLEVRGVTAEELSAETGAGALVIGNFTAGNAEICASAGSIEAEGTIERNADIECGAGSIKMMLHGTEEDYDYELECSMGEIIVGRNTYSGLSSEKTIRNGGRGVMDVECSVGNIEINFID